MLSDTEGRGVDRANCTLVIPAYNEEGRIRSLLEDVSAFAGDLIFVCDGTDATSAIIRTFADENPTLRIRCLTFPDRLGKGGGVIAGMTAAATRYVGYMDADGSTAIGQMYSLFDLLQSADGVIGSRWVSGSVLTVKQSLWRQAESRLFNMLVNLLFSLGYRDTQCGAKVFRKEALDAVLPGIRSTGFEFDVELLWRLRRMGYQVKEAPIVWENRDESKVKTSDAKNMLLGLLRVRFG
jgi:dolichol-phosphate mannosyltransferase